MNVPIHLTGKFISTLHFQVEMTAVQIMSQAIAVLCKEILEYHYKL